MVEQAALSHGQSFQAGSVELRFLADTPTAPVVRIVSTSGVSIPRPPPLPSTPSAAAPGYCKSHPRTAARFHCPKCRLSFCEICVNTRQTGGITAKYCRSCGTACTPLKVRLAARAAARATFASELANAFYYPLKRDGLTLLATGTIFLTLLNGALYLCQFAPIYGWVASGILGIYGIGYFSSALRRIVTSSATGEEAMPDWPDVTDFSGDILGPFLQLVGTLIISFLPAIVVRLFVPKEFAHVDEARLAAEVFGYAYFPMAFLALSMLDSIGAVNPVLVVVAISKMPGKYLVTILVFAAVMVVRATSRTYLPRFLPIPFVPGVLSSFVGLYLLTVLARILGLLYRDNKAKLGWFNH